MSKPPLETRVVHAAEAALLQQHYVSAIDVLCGIGWLLATQVEDWRKGRLDFLERVIQGSWEKNAFALKTLERWATEKGLNPTETEYVRVSRGATVALQFTAGGLAEIEKRYRIHYVSPALSEQKKQKLQEKLAQASQPVVFQVVRASECSECGAEIAQGSFLSKDGELALCLSCAGLEALEFLPSGDAALTRRATKYSQQSAVVVRFSRTRGRYERQGILVESSALEKAEQECVNDFEERAAARVLGAEQRRVQDRQLVSLMTEQIGILFPGCPRAELHAIAEHTALRGSGRVGRTEAGRSLEQGALTAAVVAAIRHNHTGYDDLLAKGVDRVAARLQVAGRIDAILGKWRR